RPRRRCSARYTIPMPPWPTSEIPRCPAISVPKASSPATPGLLPSAPPPRQSGAGPRSRHSIASCPFANLGCKGAEIGIVRPIAVVEQVVKLKRVLPQVVVLAEGHPAVGSEVLDVLKIVRPDRRPARDEGILPISVVLEKQLPPRSLLQQGPAVHGWVPARCQRGGLHERRSQI